MEESYLLLCSLWILLSPLSFLYSEWLGMTAHCGLGPHTSIRKQENLAQNAHRMLHRNAQGPMWPEHLLSCASFFSGGSGL